MSTLFWNPDVLSLTLASLHAHMMPIREGLAQYEQNFSPTAPQENNSDAWLAHLASKQSEHDQELFALVNADFQKDRADPNALSQTQLLKSLFTMARTLEFTQEEAQVLAHAWMNQSRREGHFDPIKWPQRIKDFVSKEETSPYHFEPCGPLGLYAVLPDAEWVDKMAQAGVPTVQLRFKSDDPEAIKQQVKRSVQAVQGTNTLLFINDHWQLAIEHGAYGIHLGQEDLEDLGEASLKEIEAAQCRLGISTHGYTEMLKAHAIRPSYMALGAVFPTTLKRMQTLPQGLGRLRAYAQLMCPYSGCPGVSDP